jgi:sulfocyanin
MTFRTLGSLGLLLSIVSQAAGQTAPSARLEPGMLAFDTAAKTVTFELVAGMTTANGSLNFNGTKGGALTLTVPRGWAVTLNFANRDKNLPHSAQVVTGQGPLPVGPGTSAFPGAASADPGTGVPSTAAMEPIRFVAATAGEYRIFCAVPGHGMAGMWLRLTVDPAARHPSISTPD